MEFESYFKGKTILVTGANGFVGSSLKLALLSFGANLVLLDIQDEGEVDGPRGQNFIRVDSNSRYYKCDLENEEERRATFRSIAKEFPIVDGIVNSAAFVGDSKLDGWSAEFEFQTLETWKRAFEVNLNSVFELSQILLPSLRRAGNAAIVNISSVYGEKGPCWDLYEGTSMGNPAAYAASKGGLIQLTRWLATTLAPSIRVNSIVGGGIQRSQPISFIKRYSDGVPLKRMATEKDYLGPILFLLSQNSAYITGESLHVDGGRGIW